MGGIVYTCSLPLNLLSGRWDLNPGPLAPLTWQAWPQSVIWSIVSKTSIVFNAVAHELHKKWKRHL
jgi:hypothetical protein